MIDPTSGIAAIADAVAAGEVTATAVARATLDRIRAIDPAINAFTAITAERALDAAQSIDALRAQGAKLPPLAGVPFAVKNLFDVAGLATLAGAKINREHAPAAQDATIVRRLSEAGAILVGALNMDEYAYGFTTENTHFGATRNPHDRTRIAGGSSGGSAAAVGAGLVPLALGSDTNGSIRVPASFCGIFGLKPTYGRLSRAGTFPFVGSFDHVGPFARSVRDLALAYDAMQGPDRRDPVCATRHAEPVAAHLPDGLRGIRLARLGGYFDKHAGPEAHEAVDIVTRALGSGTSGGAVPSVEWPEVERARAAAFVITGAEGSALHLPNLRKRPFDFEPITRDRLLAGALVPAAWIFQAQRFRRWFRAAVLETFARTDVFIAGATPFPAPVIGTETLTMNGVTMPARPANGLLTQPISFIGLPVVTVPVHRPGKLPIGVQLVGAPWREDLVFRVAAALEAAGVVQAPVATAA
jgi:AtzE family amidohydrolase